MRLSLSLNAIIIVALVFSSTLFTAPAHAQTASACVFTRTLTQGDTGEDVLCLQKYLNTTNHKIATTGVGAPGKETTSYGSLTTAAILSWQKTHSIAGANGNFGPASQAKYKELIKSNSGVTGSPTNASELLSLVDSLQTQLNGQTGTGKPAPQVAGVNTSADLEKTKAAAWVKELVDLLKDTDELIEDADEEEQVEFERDLRDVRVDAYALILRYVAGDYDEVQSNATAIIDDVTEVFEDAGGESENEEAEEKIEDVEDLIEDVEDLIAEAQDDNEDIGDAEDLLADAKDYYKDAQKALENRNYRQAMSDALDAEELLEDARKEIDVVSDDDAEEFVEDVWEAFDDAVVEVDEADEDGEDVEESEEFLDDAERELKRSDIAIDEEEWDEAIDFAEKAEDLIDEALDAIGGGNSDEADAEDSLDDAWERYRDLKDEVEEADDDGEDMADAEDYLDEVKDLLDDADDALDDEDWDEVLDLVDEIEALLDEVEDDL